MDHVQLKKELKELESQLDDAKLDKTMMSNQRGQHISSKKIMDDLKECDEEIERLEKKILELKKQMRD